MSRVALFVYESASGHVAVMFQHDDLQLCHVTSITPSGLFHTYNPTAIFYPNSKLTILTLHFITIPSVSCAI